MKVSKKQLREWYATRPIKEIMEQLKIKSTSSFYRVLRRAGISPKTLRTRVNIELVD